MTSATLRASAFVAGGGRVATGPRQNHALPCVRDPEAGAAASAATIRLLQGPQKGLIEVPDGGTVRDPGSNGESRLKTLEGGRQTTAFQ